MPHSFDITSDTSKLMNMIGAEMRDGTSDFPFDRRDYAGNGGMQSFCILGNAATHIVPKDGDFLVDSQWAQEPANCSEIPGNEIPCTSFQRVNGAFVRVESLRNGIRGGCWREAVYALNTTPEQIIMQLGTKGPQAFIDFAATTQHDCCSRCRQTLAAES